jgi:serine protease inhibitor
MKILMNSVIFILIVTGLSSASVASEKHKGEIANVVADNNTFMFDLYAKLKIIEGNIFFSPYSIFSALAMTYGGARCNTEIQMSKVMHFEKKMNGFQNAFAELEERLNDVQKKRTIKFDIANSLWMQKDYKFLPSFIESTEQNYKATISYVNYKTETEKARATINSWVEQKTNDRIKDLIPPNVLSPVTRLVLANAIYFKGTWEAKFDTAMTKDMPFWVSAKDSVVVRMMASRDRGPDYFKHKFGYKENSTLQCLEMPYLGREVSMVIVLPKARDGLEEIENKINVLWLDSLVLNLEQEKVHIHFPKFKISQECMLSRVLAAMGMADAFGEKADFSGMTGTRELFISEVIHKAFVDVNEEGTEASAATATAIAYGGGFAVKKPIFFRADHPFLFFIRDNETGCILFIGRVVNPLT